MPAVAAADGVLQGDDANGIYEAQMRDTNFGGAAFMAVERHSFLEKLNVMGGEEKEPRSVSHTTSELLEIR